MSEGGWIPAWRKLFAPGHPLAPTRAAPASKVHAWLDLCQMATHQDRRHRDHHLGRGQVLVAVRPLAGRWGWSKSRVSRFIRELEARTQIGTVSGTPDGTIYDIVNYDTYAVLAIGERDTSRDAQRDSSGTAAGQEQEGSTIKERDIRANGKGYSQDFELLWSVCRRGSKKQAAAQYRKAVPSRISQGDLLARWQAYVSGRPRKFVKHLERWIRDEMWEDDDATPGEPAKPGEFYA